MTLGKLQSLNFSQLPTMKMARHQLHCDDHKEEDGRKKEYGFKWTLGVGKGTR